MSRARPRPLHGYAIIKRAEELSGGRVRMAAGTLYAALDRLNAEQLLRVEGKVVNGRARRYYDLTDEGVAALRAEADQMLQAARVVTERRAPRVRAVKPA
ncbi:Transcriptional regulator PadR-like family protein [Asanoa hainanensis]|uniref:Transcriptional regulator PadR-like family protein n=1 Tax=Asanoa hainanensis TaxID=560556 RepID=A0A239P8U5_9ACTN|nr:PadR family transcriptional regulator [Asanoa hainanensis]SNT63457.1 Transcriptional regulator PadR-like family protein [Asanoa hainanensis]